MTTITRVAPDTASAEERIAARRAERYAARSVLWDLSQLRPVRKCGRVSHENAGVGVRVTTAADGRRAAGFAGLVTCGSVWACPVCSAKIASHRQEEIETGLGEWQRRGGRVGLVTLTNRHHKGQSLADLWGAVAKAWTAAKSGRDWHDLQAEHGTPVERTIYKGARKGQTVVEPRIPVIRVVEVTHGANGWHVHVHALVLLPGDATAATVQQVGASMFTRWSARLVKAGMSAPQLRHGVDARLLVGDAGAALGEYFTKNVYRGTDAHSASYEVARGDLKEARGGNRSPFAILRGLVDVHRSGDLGDRSAADVAADEAIWAEWETVSKGRRQIVWSQGLRADLLGDEEEVTDEELAAEEVGTSEDTVAWIEPATLRHIVKARADYAILQAFEASTAEGLALLDVAESDGWRGLVKALRRRRT